MLICTKILIIELSSSEIKHKIKTIAVLWFRLYLHVKLNKQATLYLCLTELKRCSCLPRAEQKLNIERERERERGVHALNRNWADAERERCVRAGTAIPCAAKFGCFFWREKKITKGVCNVAMLATLCISNFSNYGLGHRSNRKYVLHY